MAQGQPLSPELKAFLTRPEEQRQFSGLMNDAWRAAVENCPQPNARHIGVVVGVAPTFDPSGVPRSGEWRVVGDFEGCGSARKLSVAYRFGADRQMVRIALLPGTSAADPRLQHDALMYAGMGMAKLAPRDCRNVKVVDTRFARFEGSSPPAGAGSVIVTVPWIVDAPSALLDESWSAERTGSSVSGAERVTP